MAEVEVTRHHKSLVEFMNKKVIQIVSSVVIVAIIIFAYFKMDGTGNNSQSYFAFSTSSPSSFDSNNSGSFSGSQSYTNNQYGFSVNIPKGTEAKSFEEGEGDTILIQSHDTKSFSMQIHISPFDEDVSLTAARIHKDVPDLKMQELIEIDTGGVATVAFFSTDGGTKYREIWFVYTGNLYQIIAPANQDDATGKVMESWVWK